MSEAKMLNDREDKYEGDDSEYHFSDEEINYDAEASEESKPVSATSGSPGFSGVLQKKRMLISVVVFIVLVSVLYKIVSPTTTATPDVNFGDIKTAPAVAIDTKPVTPVQQPQIAQLAAQAASSAPSSPQPVSSPQAQSVLEQAYSSAIKPAVPATNSSVPAMPAMPAQSTMPQPEAQPAAAPAVPTSPVMGAGPTLPAEPVAQAPTPSDAVSAGAPISVPGSEIVDSKVVSLAAQNQKLMERLQEQYDQRIKDYQSQNQNLQQEVQTLNTRVAGMENQLTQVVQSKEHVKGGSAEEAGIPEAAQPEAKAPHIPYNVQAIIPGRAWLKSDNGETITVAEGDEIKGIGKVSRIDPYEGIVEINVGKRTVALSYGSGG
jgi:hypothetical protein